MRNPEGLGRRAFLKAAGVAGAVALVGSALPGRIAWAAALTKAQRDKLTPDEIIQLMKKGNERFRMGQKTTQDYLAQQRASAKGQYPAAVLLSCIDSRAPAETIMDLGIGDVFNTRVAGNVANDDILGSMEFACKISGAKVVLVMGHTACGAIGCHRPGPAGQPLRPARQDPAGGGWHLVSGRALREELRLCRCGGAKECRAHDGRDPQQ
jgi:carbonic anhydrase